MNFTLSRDSIAHLHLDKFHPSINVIHRVVYKQDGEIKDFLIPHYPQSIPSLELYSILANADGLSYAATYFYRDNEWVVTKTINLEDIPEAVSTSTEMQVRNFLRRLMSLALYQEMFPTLEDGIVEKMEEEDVKECYFIGVNTSTAAYHNFDRYFIATNEKEFMESLQEILQCIGHEDPFHEGRVVEGNIIDFSRHRLVDGELEMVSNYDLEDEDWSVICNQEEVNQAIKHLWGSDVVVVINEAYDRDGNVVVSKGTALYDKNGRELRLVEA